MWWGDCGLSYGYRSWLPEAWWWAATTGYRIAWRLDPTTPILPSDHHILTHHTHTQTTHSYSGDALILRRRTQARHCSQTTQQHASTHQYKCISPPLRPVNVESHNNLNPVAAQTTGLFPTDLFPTDLFRRSCICQSGRATSRITTSTQSGTGLASVSAYCHWHRSTRTGALKACTEDRAAATSSNLPVNSACCWVDSRSCDAA